MSDIRSQTYDHAINFTPGTTPAFTDPAAAFIVAAAGTVNLVTARKDAVTLTVLAGVIYPIAWINMASSGTTATGIVALVDASASYRGWQ